MHVTETLFGQKSHHEEERLNLHHQMSEQVYAYGTDSQNDDLHAT